MKKTTGFWNNFRSKLDVLFSFRVVDEHYVLRIFGIKFCKKYPYKFDFKEASELGITTEKRSPKIIVSLTTFPGRINLVYKTITTLLQQTVKPDEVILWLANEQFPTHELPENLTRLQEFGLTIRWCEDIRSYKKLIPTLTEHPDDIIITTDDDYYYDKNLIKTLLDEHDKNPDCIIGTRAMLHVRQKSGKFKLIRRSYIYDDTYLPSYLNAFIGFGGVLYPPHSLHPDILDKEKFMKLIPTNDDAWFWLHGALQGTKIVPCKNGYKLKLYPIENSQVVGLYQINGANTTVGIGGQEAANMFMEMYPELKAKINSER